MEILYIISLMVFISYLTTITWKYGLLPSISESYYKLPSNRKFIFTLFCWGFSLPLMMLGLEQTDNVLMFLAPAGIAFVGAAAAFKGNKLTYQVHMTGAIIGVLLSHLAIWILYQQYIVGAIAFGLMIILIGLTWLKFKVNYFFWIEVIAYLSIIYCVISYGQF